MLFEPFADSVRVLNDFMIEQEKNTSKTLEKKSEISYNINDDELRSDSFLNFVYATLKSEGINTKKMPASEAIKQFNELRKEKKGGSEKGEGETASSVKAGGESASKSSKKTESEKQATTSGKPTDEEKTKEKTNEESAPIEIVKSKKGEKVSEKFRQSCLDAFAGIKTSDGREVEKIHEHAMYQMEKRDIYPKTAAKALADGEPSEGNKPNRIEYQYNGVHIIYDTTSKIVLTCIYQGKG